MSSANFNNKNRICISFLAKIFIQINVRQKIPTISELELKIPVSRGTIQNSIKILEKNKAIKLESRGHLGTFLISKKIGYLLEMAEIQYIVGVMPLPYSRKYEGLATGIMHVLENDYDIKVNMAYMNGAKKRIEMVLNHRYDFAVMSKYSAKVAILEGQKITIAKEFSLYSYLSGHVIVFANKKNEIEDGMIIGIDMDSIDQENITKIVCKNNKVTLKKIRYNQIIDKILSKEIDAAIWNEDEIRIKDNNINSVNLKNIVNEDDTTAVIIIDELRSEIAYLLDDLIDVEVLEKIQKEVIQNKIIPNY